jgi:hypothetical protein
MLDPDTAPRAELDRELAGVQRRHRAASHFVEHGARPDDIDDATLEWWFSAPRACAAELRNDPLRKLVTPSPCDVDGGGAR